MPLREDLLVPIPGDNPSGADLRHTNIIGNLKEFRRQDDAGDQGEWKIERKTAEWPKAIKLAQETLAKTSKNLEVAAYLTEALLQTEKFAGLRQGLDLVYQLMENFWDTIYPVI